MIKRSAVEAVRSALAITQSVLKATTEKFEDWVNGKGRKKGDVFEDAFSLGSDPDAVKTIKGAFEEAGWQVKIESTTPSDKSKSGYTHRLEIVFDID